MNYLLDTNVISDVVDKRTSASFRFTQMRPEDNLYSSAITEGELLYGVANAPVDRRNDLLAEITGVLVDLAGVVPVDRDAADAYSRIRYHLKVAGQPIPDNDIWIAAVAMSNGYTLVSHDVAFARIPGLRLEDWLA
jgi:tRNA(fMet)-specific endonuclease VapC